MKSVSAAYIAKEVASQRKPAECYHIWRNGGQHWRHTSGDVPVVYDGETYTPGTLSRSLVRYNSQLEVTIMTITASSIADPVVDFIANNPVEILWVSVMKLHREQIPLEADVVFIGQIKNVSFKGGQASVACVGFEHFLKKTIPAWRYQRNCNHDVFDSKCALTKSSYKTTETITLDSTKMILTGTAFGTKDDGYFIGGEVVFGDESRAVIAHVGTSITIMYKMVELASSDSVDVYPGCDGRARICLDKFNNILFFLGFEFLPLDNPAMRVSW